MWNKLPLTLKIILPLVAMEIFGLIVGGLFLVSKIEKTRLKEMDTLLLEQGDIIEEAFKIAGGSPEITSRIELFNEMDRDSKVYFRITDEHGNKVNGSRGTRFSPALEKSLLEQAERFPLETDYLFDLVYENQKWRATQELLDVPGEDKTPAKWTLFIAVDETSTIEEINVIRRMVFAGALVLGLITSLATAAIVLVSTRNLRKFAQSLQRINPDKPVWTLPVTAQSAEEGFLFSSFSKMMEEMERSRRSQRLFIANASHELKTPVAGMLAALEVLLSRERTAQDYQAVCRDILRTVRDLKRLTGTLLDASVIDGTKIHTQDAIDLSLLLSELKTRWEGPAREKSIEMFLKLPSERVEILGNQDLLEVALGNLLDNAIKYSRESGRVEIALMRLRDGHLQLSIKDKGLGMASEDKDRLGEVFFRADPSRSNKDSFGLGFANAKKILLGHDISVRVISELGRGTEILMDIPPHRP